MIVTFEIDNGKPQLFQVVNKYRSAKVDGQVRYQHIDECQLPGGFEVIQLDAENKGIATLSGAGNGISIGELKLFVEAVKQRATQTWYTTENNQLQIWVIYRGNDVDYECVIEVDEFPLERIGELYVAPYGEGYPTRYDWAKQLATLTEEFMEGENDEECERLQNELDTFMKKFPYNYYKN